MSSSINEAKQERIQRRIVFPLLFVCYAIVGVSTYRLQSVLSSAMLYFHADAAKMGVLISIPSLVCLTTTMLVGMLIVRWGYRMTLCAGMAIELVGHIIAIAMPTYGGVFVSQVSLGLGNTLILVSVPSMLQKIYEPEKYAARIGIINSAQTTGQGVVFLLLPSVVRRFGFSAVWGLFIAPIAILLLLCVFVWKRGGEQHLAEPRKLNPGRSGENTAPSGLHPLQDKHMWILSFGLLFCMLSAGAALNYTSLYLQTDKGFSEAHAGQMMFACTVVGIAASMSGGKLGQMFGLRRVYIFIALLQAALRLLIVQAQGTVLLAIITALTGVPAAMVAISNAVVPRVCQRKNHVPLAIAMVATATTGGLALSSLIFGRLVTAIGFNASFLVFAPLSLLALLAGIVIPRK